MVLKSDDFTEQAQDILGKSQDIVRRYSHSQWDVEHILMALLEHDEGVSVEIFNQVGVSVPPIVANGTVFFLANDAELIAYH